MTFGILPYIMIMRHIFCTLVIVVLIIIGASAQSIENSYKQFSDTTFEIGDKIIAEGIYFSYDGGQQVGDKSYDSVKFIADFLNSHPDMIVEIGGHQDSRGTEEYNLILSEVQSENLIKVLIDDFDISTERLVPKGYGEAQLLEDCSEYPDCPMLGPMDCPCHQTNRRVEVKIIKI